MKIILSRSVGVAAAPLLFVMLAASPLLAQEAGADKEAVAGVVVRPVTATTVTASGQPILLPQKNVQVIVTTYDIAPGAVLPVHKHPYPRYAYVLGGTLRVTNTATRQSTDYKPGDFIVEMIGEWHRGENLGTDAVRLLVIDQVPKGKANVVLRK
jgi:quercetin dioxygenase-like cupin family protein